MIDEKIRSPEDLMLGDSGPEAREEELLTELVVRARAGDDKAFGALYEYYYTAISRYLLRQTGSPDDGTDLVQETFSKAWQGLSDLEDGRRFRGWLYSIARNVLVDYLRKKKGNQPVWEYLSENYLDLQSTGFEDRVEERELVRLALMEVAPKLRSCLLLQVEDFDMRAIAEMLGLNVKSVGTYISMARMQFRQAYHRIRSAAESDPTALPTLQVSSSPEQPGSSESTRPAATGEVAGGEGETEDALDERSGILARRIGKLPAPYRRTLYLKLVKHCSNREVAAQLQLPLGTVKSHVSRGKFLLDVIMESEEDALEAIMESEEGALSEQPAVEETYVAASAELATYIGRLPAPYQRTLYLKLVKHCSNREIAAQLQLPLGTVKSHISRGKDLLRAIMEP